MTTQMAEGGGQRAKGMHWAHGKLQECKKVLQQITQEGTERHQMSETKRKNSYRTIQGKWHEAEGREWRAEGMHEAHSKFPERSRFLQITQKGCNTCSNHATIPYQMSETKRR